MKVIFKFSSVLDTMRKGGKRMDRQTDRVCYCLLLLSC